MPLLTTTTVLGDQPVEAILLPQIVTLALWFPFPTLPALRYRKVGTLRLIEVMGSRQIIVSEWAVTYPGIYPIYSRAVPTPSFRIFFNCFRPGLTYSLFWG